MPRNLADPTFSSEEERRTSEEYFAAQQAREARHRARLRDPRRARFHAFAEAHEAQLESEYLYGLVEEARESEETAIDQEAKIDAADAVAGAADRALSAGWDALALATIVRRYGRAGGQKSLAPRRPVLAPRRAPRAARRARRHAAQTTVAVSAGDGDPAPPPPRRPARSARRHSHAPGAR